MMQLADLEPGMRICGLVPGQIVEIVQVRPIAGIRRPGESSAKPSGYTVYYLDSHGRPCDQTCYQRDDYSIVLAQDSLVFGEDAQLALLALEAQRIATAHLHDPYFGVFDSNIDPLPHQIEAVYDWMLGRHPLRVLLADDPGAGKTIQAGLYIREMMAREAVRRCLIVAPGNLVQQWQDELRDKFRLHFEIGDLYRDQTVLTRSDRVILRMDQAKGDKYQGALEESRWDLIVCDEAHKMSATVSRRVKPEALLQGTTGDVTRTKRYQLGQRIRGITTHFLLMTATPHNGKDDDFQLFLQLLDEDRFEGAVRIGSPRLDTSDMVLRRMKEDLVTMDGRRLFPERKAYTANYALSRQERSLYEAVTDYCHEEFNRARRLRADRRYSVGFALMILQRRLASSPEAIYQSLRSRMQRLESERHNWSGLSDALMDIPDEDDLDETPAEELEDLEIEAVIRATAAQNIQELAAEIDTLESLAQQADAVRRSERDSKWEKLREIWERRLPEMEKDGQRRKLIIFTEYRATLDYLKRKLGELLGDPHAIVTIHGGIPTNRRRAIQQRFAGEERVQVLVATDAAGEGINLQCAHLMINYDLPWNPNRIEQRFGRIHRIGQTEVCHLWNIVTSETREGAVYSRLLEKLDTISAALGGKVFDVLGELFEERSLRELIQEGIHYGDDPAVMARLQQQVDDAVNIPHIEELMQERVLAREIIPVDDLRAKMNQLGIDHLHGSELRDFLLRVFNMFQNRLWSMRSKDGNCYEIGKIPGMILEHARGNGIAGIRESYAQVCFDLAMANAVNGSQTTEFVSPSHPLIKAAASWVEAHWAKQGPECGDALPVFIDRKTRADTWRAVFAVDWAIRSADSQNQALETKAQLLEVDLEGEVQILSLSKLRDCEVASEAREKPLASLLADFVENGARWTDFVKQHTAASLVQPQLEEISAREITRLEKEAAQVQESLQAEIDHQQGLIDFFLRHERERPESANVFRAGRIQAERRKDTFEARLNARMDKIERQKQITPSGIRVQPVALIVPSKLLHS